MTAGVGQQRLFGPLNLKGIGGQIAALVVASIDRYPCDLRSTSSSPGRSRDPPLDESSRQLALAAQLLAAAPPDERPPVIADIGRAFPQLELNLCSANPCPGPTTSRRTCTSCRRLGGDYTSSQLPTAMSAASPLRCRMMR